jgi:hypothetical protein
MEGLKRFLSTPAGWLGLILVEYGISVLLVRTFMPDGISSTAWWTIVITWVVGLTVFNYWLRRRWHL